MRSWRPAPSAPPCPPSTSRATKRAGQRPQRGRVQRPPREKVVAQQRVLAGLLAEDAAQHLGLLGGGPLAKGIGPQPRDDGGHDRAAPRRGEDQGDPVRRLLEQLEKGVARALVDRLRALDDRDFARAAGRQVRPLGQAADLLDRDAGRAQVVEQLGRRLDDGLGRFLQPLGRRPRDRRAAATRSGPRRRRPGRGPAVLRRSRRPRAPDRSAAAACARPGQRGSAPPALRCGAAPRPRPPSPRQRSASRAAGGRDV